MINVYNVDKPKNYNLKHKKKDFIIEYFDIFSNKQCQEIINYILNLEKNSLLIDEDKYTSMNIKHHTFNTADNFNHPISTFSLDNIYPKIKYCVNHYVQEYSVLKNNKFLLNFLKFKKIPEHGGFFDWHCEQSNLHNIYRTLVIQIYLNDNFINGETEFKYYDKKIVPEVGKVLIYPAAYTHTHRGNPPIGGVKYLVSTWGFMQ